MDIGTLMLREMIFQQLEELRKSFAVEMTMHDVELPASFDEVDDMFRGWLMKQYAAYHDSVDAETKQMFEQLRDIVLRAKAVVCERCGGNGWDPNTWYEGTRQLPRLYCPRCGGSGVHRNEQ